jgi:hypothetical protein
MIAAMAVAFGGLMVALAGVGYGVRRALQGK